MITCVCCEEYEVEEEGDECEVCEALYGHFDVEFKPEVKEKERD